MRSYRSTGGGKPGDEAAGLPTVPPPARCADSYTLVGKATCWLTCRLTRSREWRDHAVAPGEGGSRDECADDRMDHRGDSGDRRTGVGLEHSRLKQRWSLGLVPLLRMVGREENRDLAAGQLFSQLCARVAEEFAVYDGDRG